MCAGMLHTRRERVWSICKWVIIASSTISSYGMRCPCGSRICLQLFISILFDFPGIFIYVLFDAKMWLEQRMVSHQRMFARVKPLELGTTLCKFSQKYHFLRTFILTAASLVAENLENKRRKLMGSHSAIEIIISFYSLLYDVASAWQLRAYSSIRIWQWVRRNSSEAKEILGLWACWLGMGTVETSINRDMTHDVSLSKLLRME